MNNKIKKIEEDVKVLKKLYFMRNSYDKKTIEEAAYLEKISILTSYNWLNRWNENRIRRSRKKNPSGRLGILSQEDKEKLDKNFLKLNF